MRVRVALHTTKEDATKRHKRYKKFAPIIFVTFVLFGG
jgi:hypothetical protein